MLRLKTEPVGEAAGVPATAFGARLEALVGAHTRREVGRALVAIAAISVLFRIVMATVAHAPIVFSDELGYEKLAESLGRTGHLALFNNPGLSYSPLYPLVISPIYALGLSAPTAYNLVKVVNAVLMSLAVVPTYKIARFALPRRQSLIVAALSIAAPLMFYSSLSMSENVAYPICLAAIWAMLATVREPSARHDALLLVAMLAAAAARAELAVLVPASLTAVLLVALLDRPPSSTLRSRLAHVSRRHGLLFGVVAGGLIVAGAGALAGKGVFSVFGRYAEVGRESRPNFNHFLDLLVQHVAELDIAVGVIPFVAALVAAVALSRRGVNGAGLRFAAVAVSTTVWLLIAVAYDAAVFDGHGDLPRIHERFLIYVVPFFFVALFAAIRRTDISNRTYLTAVVTAALLPLAIPFGDVINQPSAVDTFGLQALAHVRRGKVVPLPHAALLAVFGAALLGLLFTYVRHQTRSVVLLMLIPLFLISGQVLSRIGAGSLFARSILPAKANWVDAAKPKGTVVLLTDNEGPTAALETAYMNSSISRLFYLCRPAAGAEFGEQQATVSHAGLLLGPDGAIEADYVVAPTPLDVLGRVVARNVNGRQLLVALPHRQLRVLPLMRDASLDCGT